MDAIRITQILTNQTADEGFIPDLSDIWLTHSRGIWYAVAVAVWDGPPMSKMPLRTETIFHLVKEIGDTKLYKREMDGAIIVVTNIGKRYETVYCFRLNGFEQENAPLIVRPKNPFWVPAHDTDTRFFIEREIEFWPVIDMDLGYPRLMIGFHDEATAMEYRLSH